MKKTSIIITVLIVLIFIWAKESKAPIAPGYLVIPENNNIPLINAKSRITKKFFGTYVTPANSPIQPERFTGYHTGLDFETTLAEQNQDMPVYAICDGPLKIKESATGYGGAAVQSCFLSGQAATVIYGHLKITSVRAIPGTQLKKGDMLGILGKGYSIDTGGERKHLHLGIHKGSIIDIRGYVQNRSELSGWLNPRNVLGF